MTDSARDYALPIDGTVQRIPCGYGTVLAAELTRDTDIDPDLAWIFLWIHQEDTALTDRTVPFQRSFTTRVGREPWPDGAHHVATVRDTHRSVHVLEVAP